jgi:hypothetical protein
MTSQQHGSRVIFDEARKRMSAQQTLLAPAISYYQLHV